MKFNFKSPMMANVLMAAVGTAVLAGIRKEFGVGDLVLAFAIIMAILYFIDVFSRFTSIKAGKRAAQKLNKQQGHSEDK